MLRLIALIFMMVFTLSAQAQMLEDVIHLKNGSIIRGMIIETIPGVSI